MIQTPRLLVRPWCDADRAAFAAMGRDPEVMRYLGPLMTRADSDAGVDRMLAAQARDGFCFWAVEQRDDGAFVGFCGLKRVDFAGVLNGTVEIGWRLRRESWGLGLASEAARAVCDWGFANGLARIVSFTATGNLASQRVMQRIGMVRRADLDFDHPVLAAGDPLRRHVVYDIEPA